MSESFAPLMKEVAKILLPSPNKRLSSETEWRYGTNGSLCVDLTLGTFHDFEDGKGGGVKDLISKIIKGTDSDVYNWLKKHNLEFPKNNASSISSPKSEPQRRLEKTYDYVDQDGVLQYQVCRFEIIDDAKKKKSFAQRRLVNEQWVYNLDGIKPIPYKLPELIESIALQKPIYIVEGEKDAERLLSLGLSSTTNSGGASQWPTELVRFFAGADVIIIPDNDEIGRKHASDIAKALKGTASSIKLLELPNLPDKGDASDYFDNGGSVKKFNELKPIPYAGEEIFRSKFSAIRLADIDLPGLEHEWLIKGLLTRGERSMVAGPSQSGKSFAVLDMALAVSRGVDYQSYAQIGGEGDFNMRSFKTRRGGVVYQAGEGGRGLKKRLRAYIKHHNIANDLPFVLLPSPVDLHSQEEHSKQLIAEIKHWAKIYESEYQCPLELVVIDTLSAATPGANENASEDMSKVLARCERIARETNTHVMFVHHMNAGGEKPRGHTSIFANLDNVLTIRRLDESEPPKDGKPGREVREMVVTKSKDGEDGTAIKFVLQSIPLGEDEDGDPITSCVCIPPQGLFGSKTIEKQVTLNDKLMVGFKALIKALEEEGKQAPNSLMLGKNVKTISFQTFLKFYSAMSLEAEFETDPEKKQNLLKSSLVEIGRGLMAKGLLARDGNTLWWTGVNVKGLKTYIPRANHINFDEDLSCVLNELEHE